MVTTRFATAVFTALRATTEDEHELVLPLREAERPLTPTNLAPNGRTDRSRPRFGADRSPHLTIYQTASPMFRAVCTAMRATTEDEKRHSHRGDRSRGSCAIRQQSEASSTNRRVLCSRQYHSPTDHPQGMKSMPSQ